MKTMGSDASFFFTISGGSMRPALRESDLIEATPPGDRPARVGDVILFTPPGAGRVVAHRVVRVTKEGVYTRGDNNARKDAFLVRPGEIEGRVTAVWRGSRRGVVAGGPRGRWTARLSGPRRVLGRFLSRLLHAPYHALARRGVMHRFLPDALKPRVVLFRENGRDLPKLLIGRRVVGRFDPAAGDWIVQRPFRLFVDASGLPRCSPPASPGGASNPGREP
ncbi:MAG: S26 family signal peptidase [Desulfobacterales bacterium]|nr:S26 family signal peptidase [Desulfobacterales bacterium]